MGFFFQLCLCQYYCIDVPPELQRKAWKKARRKLHQNARYCFEQILTAAPHKTVIVQPPATHLTNHLSEMRKTCEALLGKLIRADKRRFWTPTHGHTSFGRPAGTYIHQLCVDTGYSLNDLSGAMYDRDRW